jgi:hypothetical protein
VKNAAAEAHLTLWRLDGDIAREIIAAADEILAGRLRKQFVVDVYQAGAGGQAGRAGGAGQAGTGGRAGQAGRADQGEHAGRADKT